MKPISENSLTVLNFLKSNPEENYTAADIAKELGMEVKTVNGVVTAGLIRNKDLVVRVPAEMELADGTHQPIKLIKLTEAGANYDHDKVTAEYEAEQAAAKAAKASE